MPIVTRTEDNKTRYYAVNDGSECRLDALIGGDYEIASCGTREYAEHALHREYLRRLTEHAYECALLAHFVLNPPDDDELAGNLRLKERLAEKIAKDAVWPRTFEPFAALTAEVVSPDGGDTGLQIGDTFVGKLYDDASWEATEHAMWERDPWRRDHFARIEQEKAEKKAGDDFTPAGRKRVDIAAKAYVAAVNRAIALKERSTKKKTLANKTVRRSKRRAA